jgi:broad specificity phosphatase PhoE
MTVQQLEQTRAPRPICRPADQCDIYLVRHGTTTMNVSNRYRGRRDVPLDAQGYQDAVDAARALSDKGLHAVYTGPLRRTIATAQIIADEALVPDLRILHGLNNLDYGAWEGMTSDEASVFDPLAFDLYRTSPDLAACPLGERLTAAQERIVGALQPVGERHPGEAVAAVTHAVMIRLAVAYLTKVEGEQWRIPVGRGSLTLMSVRGGRIEVLALPTGDDVD